MSKLIVLFESAVGYSLFEIKQWEEIQENSKDFLQSVMEYKALSQAVTLLGSHQFKTAKEALDNIKAISNKECSSELNQFLSTNLPLSKKKSSSSFTLGVIDKGLAQKIKESLNVNVEVGTFIVEITRVIRTFYHKFLKIDQQDVLKAQLGLGHQYSRMKCTFDVNREDKPVIQSIALIEQLDKNINSFCMRIKEWFGWHFPELSKIVTDNAAFVKVVSLIQNKERLIEEGQDDDSTLRKELIEICVEPEIALRVYEAATQSMGSELSEIDAENIRFFCEKVISLVTYREGLGGYLKDKMKNLAPNTSTLVGDTLAAKLISHSGSLSNLCKYPASTIQILGAEKALFRALKARSGKTPKYGLLYHSHFIGKASAKNKGKISRYLANKIAQSSRIDFFAEKRENTYGEEFRKQVEERMNFLVTGEKPRKNADAVKEAKAKLSLLENGHSNGKNGKKHQVEEDDSDVEDKKLLGKKQKKKEEKENKDKKKKKAKSVDTDSD